jgi:hypothetical protein
VRGNTEGRRPRSERDPNSEFRSRLHCSFGRELTSAYIALGAIRASEFGLLSGFGTRTSEFAQWRLGPRNSDLEVQP